MKKIILILFLSFFLFACDSPDDKLSDYEILLKVADTISLPEEISSNIELNNSYKFNQHTVTAIWESDNEEVSSSNGIIFPSFEE